MATNSVYILIWGKLCSMDQNLKNLNILVSLKWDTRYEKYELLYQLKEDVAKSQKYPYTFGDESV